MNRNGEIDEAPATPLARPDEEGPIGRTDEWPDDRAGRDPGDLVSGLSPRQIIGGFALLAGLILMIRRSRRKKG